MSKILLGIFLSALMIGVCSAENEIPTKEAIHALLPAGMDPPSTVDVENRAKIQVYGEVAIPILASLLAETTNSVDMSVIIDIAAEIEGDHSTILRQLHVCLQDDKTKTIALHGLQRVGSAEDAKQILNMLDDKDESVRINVAKLIQLYADKETLEQAKVILNRRAASLSQEEQYRDWSIKAGYCAVSNGFKRLKGKAGVQ